MTGFNSLSCAFPPLSSSTHTPVLHPELKAGSVALSNSSHMTGWQPRVPLDALQAKKRQQTAAEALGTLVDTSITAVVQQVGHVDAASLPIRRGARRAATASQIHSAERLECGAPAPSRRRTTTPGTASEWGEPSPRVHRWSAGGPLQQPDPLQQPRRNSTPGAGQRRLTAPGVLPYAKFLPIATEARACVPYNLT